jgi:hypothetical protein
VVLRQLYLALAVSHNLCGMFSIGATCLLIDAAVTVGCVLLAVLLEPLLAGLSTLLGTLDGDAG